MVLRDESRGVKWLLYIKERERESHDVSVSHVNIKIIGYGYSIIGNTKPAS